MACEATKLTLQSGFKFGKISKFGKCSEACIGTKRDKKHISNPNWATFEHLIPTLERAVSGSPYFGIRTSCLPIDVNVVSNNFLYAPQTRFIPRLKTHHKENRVFVRLFAGGAPYKNNVVFRFILGWALSSTCMEKPSFKKFISSNQVLFFSNRKLRVFFPLNRIVIISMMSFGDFLSILSYLAFKHVYCELLTLVSCKSTRRNHISASF